MKTNNQTRNANLSAIIAGIVVTVLPLATFAAVGGPPVPVPEPDTILLVGVGAAAVWLARFIKK